jgi:hypothetical protein
MRLLNYKVIDKYGKTSDVKAQNLIRCLFSLSSMNEIHELGLMYLNYDLLHGYKTIYLGESMPIDNLKDLKNISTSIVSYLTVQPEGRSYAVEKWQEELLDDNTECGI